MNYYSINYKTNSLTHHGILGQKWGKRNGPPYPLGVNQHSASERKSGWRKSLNKKNFKLTSKQKKIIAGVLIASAAIGASVYLAKHPDLISKGKGLVSNIVDIKGIELDKNFKLTKDNASKCASGINPTHSSTNCGSCSSAVLLNTLGGNYKALDSVPEHMRINGGQGYDPEKLIKCFDGAKWSDKITSFSNSRRQVSNQLEKELISQGNGASGIFYCEGQTKNRPGHYFCFTIIDNQVHVLEGQPPGAQSQGIDFHENFFDDVGKLFRLDDGNLGVYWARLDNHLPLEDRLDDLVQKK